MTEELLRKVVDVTWGRAHEDRSVPASNIVSQIVAEAKTQLGEPHVSDDMIRAAINAHGSSQGPNEWEWMRDALIAALHA